MWVGNLSIEGKSVRVASFAPGFVSLNGTLWYRELDGSTGEKGLQIQFKVEQSKHKNTDVRHTVQLKIILRKVDWRSLIYVLLSPVSLCPPELRRLFSFLFLFPFPSLNLLRPSYSWSVSSHAYHHPRLRTRVLVRHLTTLLTHAITTPLPPFHLTMNAPPALGYPPGVSLAPGA